MNDGTEFEEDVRQIYSYLLNMRDEGILVARRAKIKGKSNTSNEIDVYYQFKKAGVLHQVAIECKDWNGPIPLKEVRDFRAKLDDIGSVVGIVISRNGLQEGAQDYCDHHRISVLDFGDLPKLGELIAQRIGSLLLPDEDVVGEPFWTIMELRDGKLSGNHLALPGDSRNSKERIPLFYSRRLAETYIETSKLDKSQWSVRGLPQHAFRGFLTTLELYENGGRAEASLIMLPPGARPDAKLIELPVTAAHLKMDYYLPAASGR
ncbi:restriction endonuclease [Rhizobium sp. Rhizsp82]|uniref:restriction endonuclease n=1 Tax=Rhizobium sp. Rhizsp82 TaxID=3243057 RepID=UPI0039B45EB0